MSCKSMLSNEWVNNIVEVISMNLSRVSKGWYNMHETNTETYEFSKLKKLLTIIKYMMQESILKLCHRSVDLYISTLKKLIPTKVIIQSINNVCIDAPNDFDHTFSLIILEIVPRFEEVYET